LIALVSIAISLSAPPPPPASGYGARPRKNWDTVTNTILKAEKDKTTSDDPNAGGDGAVNNFFQKLYSDADEDTRRAMMKSYMESGGTTLSTNWDEVKKETVTVKPPEGSEWRKWG
jgi:suppressor of G2 allele of SKP1